MFSPKIFLVFYNKKITYAVIFLILIFFLCDMKLIQRDDIFAWINLINGIFVGLTYSFAQHALTLNCYKEDIIKNYSVRGLAQIYEVKFKATCNLRI